MTEQWENIAGYVGKYQVSNYGAVRSLPRGGRKQLLILKLGKDMDGYRQVVMYSGRKRTTRKVHQLVLETFGTSRRHRDSVTRHLDGDKDNNRIDNLVWGTQTDNARDAVRHKTSPGLKSHGVNNGQSKLTESDVCCIKRLLGDGSCEQQKIASMFGVCKQTITFIKQGKTWKEIGDLDGLRRSKSKVKRFKP